MEKYKWTAEADEMVRQMLADGRTVADICDALGITDTQLKNHLHVLRRKDRGFRLANGGEDNEVEICEAVPDPAATAAENVTLVPKGELNPLEQEMARMIEEREKMLQVKEAELEKARREARWLQDELDKKNVQNEKLGQKLAAKDRIIAKMAAEIYGEV